MSKIKQVRIPNEALYARLQKRAKQNKRSTTAELEVILENALN